MTLPPQHDCNGPRRRYKERGSWSCAPLQFFKEAFFKTMCRKKKKKTYYVDWKAERVATSIVSAVGALNRSLVNLRNFFRVLNGCKLRCYAGGWANMSISPHVQLKIAWLSTHGAPLRRLDISGPMCCNPWYGCWRLLVKITMTNADPTEKHTRQPQ